MVFEWDPHYLIGIHRINIVVRGNAGLVIVFFFFRLSRYVCIRGCIEGEGGGRIQCELGTYDDIEEFIGWYLYLKVRRRFSDVEKVIGVVPLKDFCIPKLDIDSEYIIILVYFWHMSSNIKNYSSVVL